MHYSHIEWCYIVNDYDMMYYYDGLPNQNYVIIFLRKSWGLHNTLQGAILSLLVLL